MIVSPDLNIESQFFTYIHTQLSPEYMIEKRIEGQYLNYLKSLIESNYFNLYKDNLNISFNYPIHETIKDELELEGLKVVTFTRDDIDNLTSYEFEVENNDLDIDAIEYNIIKRLDLASKGITITVY